MVEEHKPCPFCGSQPTFTKPQWQDDNYYVEMKLQCCVEMSDAISWRKARAMSSEQIETQLRTTLTVCWNTRYTEENDAN